MDMRGFFYSISLLRSYILQDWQRLKNSGADHMECVIAALFGFISIAVLWLVIKSATAAGIRQATGVGEPSNAAQDEIPFLVKGRNLSGARITLRVVASDQADAGRKARAEGLSKLTSIELIRE